MKNFLAFAFLWMALSVPLHAGLPTLDSAAQTEVVVNGLSFKIIQDSDVEGQWYYIPPRLRLVEENGIAKARVVIYVADGRENGIVQAEVTAAATDPELDAMKNQASKWYSDKGMKVPTIALSIIGPLRSSTFRMLTLKNTGNSFSLRPLWDPVGNESPVSVSVEKSSEIKVTGELEDEEKAPEGEGPAAPGTGEGAGNTASVVKNGELTLKNNQKLSIENASPDLAGRGITIPGSDLSQNISIQFELSGAGVQIYEQLLMGKTGGLALIWVGEYDAMSMPAKVDISLKVSAAQSYFRKYEQESSSKRFLFWGSSSKKVTDFIRTSNFMDRSLEVKIDGNPEVLSDERLDQISESLMKWVLTQCFTTKQVPATAKGAISEAGAPNTEMDLGNFSTLFGLPPLNGLGLNIGFSSGSSSYTADYRSDNNITAKASWNRRTIVKRPIAIAGNVSFGSYPDPESYVTRVKIEPLPKVFIRLPQFADKERQSMLADSFFTLTIPSARGSAKFTWGLDANADAWRFPGDTSMLGIDEATRLKEYPNCPRIMLNKGENTSDAGATIVLNRLNAHLGHQPAEIDRLQLPKRGVNEGTEIIDFAGERFPLRLAEFDLSQFPFGNEPGGISSVKISCGVEPVLDENGQPVPGTVDFTPRTLDREPVSLPTFTATQNKPIRFLYPGGVTGLRAEVTYIDLFSRTKGTHDWIVRAHRREGEVAAVNGEEILTRLALGSGSVVMQPVDIGIRDYRINPLLLFKQLDDALLITATLTGENGGKFSKEWVKPEDSAMDVFHFVTKDRIGGMLLTVDNSDGSTDKLRLKDDRIAIINGAVGTSTLLKAHFEEVE